MARPKTIYWAIKLDRPRPSDPWVKIAGKKLLAHVGVLPPHPRLYEDREDASDNCCGEGEYEHPIKLRVTIEEV